MGTDQVCSFSNCGKPIRGRGPLCEAHSGQQRRGKPLTVITRVVRKGLCDFPNCGRPHFAHGLCESHSAQQERGVVLHAITPRGSYPTSCSFAGCAEPPLAKGLCEAHYAQQRRGSDLTPLRVKAVYSDTCTVSGCVKPSGVMGLCFTHYQRQKRKDAAPCAFMGCSGTVLAKGLCPGHYQQERKGQPLVSLVPPVVVAPGEKYGLWTIIQEMPKKDDRRSVLVQCVCGAEAVHAIYTITSGASSGCHTCRAQHGEESVVWTGCGGLSGGHWGQIVLGASVRGLCITITKEEAWALFERQEHRCALSKVPLDLGVKGKTASLDRIDSSKGYFLENIQWIHKDLNRMKGSLSDADFIKWCQIVASASGTLTAVGTSPI